MTDRAQPGAIDSVVRNYELGDIFGQFSDGWVVPADEPTASAQRSGIDETAFTAFDATYSAPSLTVTIGPGEAFIDGWLATDSSTDVDLAASTAGQTVGVSWDPDAAYDPDTDTDRDAADRVVVALEGDVSSVDPFLPLWTFDTDGSGVTSAVDERELGPSVSPDNLAGANIPAAPSGEFLRKATEGLEFAEIVAGATVQETAPSNASEGDLWYDPDSGIFKVYADNGIGLDWHSIPPVQVLEEAVTFNESDVSITTTNTTVSGGGVGLVSLSPWDIENAVYSGKTLSVARTETPRASGFEWKPDGTKLFVVDYFSNFLYEYDVSTAWDISTASYSGRDLDLSISPNAREVAFGPDGELFWVISQDNGAIYEYKCTAPWDISTGDYNSESLGLDDTNNNGELEGFEWKPDGTVFWVVDLDSRGVYEYDVSTAWDISTASYTGTSYFLEGAVTGIAWKPDGTKFWEVDSGTYNYIREHDVSTAWDISTASYSETIRRITSENHPTGVEFKADGTSFWVVGWGTLHEYFSSSFKTGSVTIGWDSGTPADINSYDLATFQRSEDGETVTIDVEDGNGNVLFSDIGPNFDISAVDTSKNVKLRANLSRTDTANNPTLDYAARRYTR